MTSNAQAQVALLLRLAELADCVYDLGIRPLGAILVELFARAEVVVVLRQNAGRALSGLDAWFAGLYGAVT